MEFKGTKGIFKDGYTGWKSFKYPPDSEVGFSTHEIHYSDDGECVAEIVHGDANALLISKAPEILEFLQSIVSDYENGLIEDIEHVAIRAEQLIESATELK